MSDRVFVHLIVFDPDGPIKTQTMRLRVACHPTSGMPMAASNAAMTKVITCPKCLESEEFKALCEDNFANEADAAAAEYVKKGT